MAKKTVPLTTKPNATFSEYMRGGTLSTSTVQLYQVSVGKGNNVSSVTLVGATPKYDSSTKAVTLAPSSALKKNTLYMVKITTGAQDQAGNALKGNQTTASKYWSAGDHAWFFKTGSS